ncbi:hypothetical protein GCM10028777_00420 [Angustibacter speluncae]
MGLNIKNERVHRLAREAAALTGTSQTGAIERALEMYLRAHGTDPEAARTARKIDVVRSLVRQYASMPGDEDREIVTVEDLYDLSTGLPT